MAAGAGVPVSWILKTMVTSILSHQWLAAESNSRLRPAPGEDDVSFEIDNSRAFVNLGDGSFTESAESLGLLEEEMGRGVVCADFDEDGDVDILLLHDKATLWRNDLEGNTYLRIKLQGKAPNTEAQVPDYRHS